MIELYMIRPMSLLLWVLLLHTALWGQSGDASKIKWQRGPATAKIGDQATVKLPEETMFTDPEGAKLFLELTENIPSGDELGILTDLEGKWFVIFRFMNVGYIKDDEKSSLDADALMKSIREGTEAANAERRKRGWGTMDIVGWIQPPHYDETTHNLEWSLEGKQDNGAKVINQNTRYLGRRGYMSVELVLDPKDSAAVMSQYRSALAGFSYTPEGDYRAFVRGDKVAEYGLSALVLGGAAAVATKTGLFKLIGKFLIASWKLVAVALVGLGSMIKKLLAGRRAEPVTPETIE